MKTLAAIVVLSLTIPTVASAQWKQPPPIIDYDRPIYEPAAPSGNITVFGPNNDVDIGSYSRENRDWTVFRDNGSLEQGRINSDGSITIMEYD